jgi:hypothetical protein
LSHMMAYHTLQILTLLYSVQISLDKKLGLFFSQGQFDQIWM